MIPGRSGSITRVAEDPESAGGDKKEERREPEERHVPLRKGSLSEEKPCRHDGHKQSGARRHLAPDEEAAAAVWRDECPDEVGVGDSREGAPDGEERHRHEDDGNDLSRSSKPDDAECGTRKRQNANVDPEKEVALLAVSRVEKPGEQHLRHQGQTDHDTRKNAHGSGTTAGCEYQRGHHRIDLGKTHRHGEKERVPEKRLHLSSSEPTGS
jgi:hypothetical protein